MLILSWREIRLFNFLHSKCHSWGLCKRAYSEPAMLHAPDQAKTIQIVGASRCTDRWICILPEREKHHHRSECAHIKHGESTCRAGVKWGKFLWVIHLCLYILFSRTRLQDLNSLQTLAGERNCKSIVSVCVFFCAWSAVHYLFATCCALVEYLMNLARVCISVCII